MDNQGFSLIEMLIVLAILGIIAVFSYPSYQDAITRSRRIDGQTALLDLANRLEQYYSEHQTYQGATLATGRDTDVLSSSFSLQNWYRLSISEQTNSSFLLHAQAINAQANNDPFCQILTFDNFGKKTKEC